MSLTLVKCKVSHTRYRPKKIKFDFNFFMYLLNCKHLDRAKTLFRIISFNKANLYSFWKKDHFFFKDSSNLQADLLKYATEKEPKLKANKVLLLTNIRFMGYVFNPVSFYLYFDDEQLTGTLLEVNNTFGEQKLFFSSNVINNSLKINIPKLFYVSPFIEHDSNFDITINWKKDKFFININSMKEAPILSAKLWGEMQPTTIHNIIKMTIIKPFVTLQIIGLIHFRALLLWLKGIRFYKKEEKKSLQQGIIYGKNSN